MAKRSRTASTTRRATHRRGSPRSAARSDNGAGGKDRAGHDTPRRPFDEFAEKRLDPSALLDRAHPLGRVSALLLLQGLEWQSAALEVYRRALQDGAFDAPVEDHLRKVARSLMSAYLEFVKSLPERRERLVAQQSELVKAVSEAIEDLRQRLVEPPA